MTYREWWAARRFLFDERFGTLLRQGEREARAKEEEQVAAYQRSVTHLKAQQDAQQEP